MGFMTPLSKWALNNCVDNLGFWTILVDINLPFLDTYLAKVWILKEVNSEKCNSE